MIRGASLVGLLCVLTAVGVAAVGPPTDPCAAGSAPVEAVLAEGCDLCSTADAEQRELIRSLTAADGPAAQLTIDYPLDESVFPPEIVPPTFRWHDDTGADRWIVDVTFGDPPSRIQALVPDRPPPRGEIDARCITRTNELYEPTPYQASARTWKPSMPLWEAIKTHSVERPATVTLLGYRSGAPDTLLSRSSMTLTTSRDPVGAPIFYRDVPLMPSAGEDGVIKPLDPSSLPLINWRLRDVSLPESRVLLRDMPTCANCHSFSADGKTLGMDVDGPDGDKGAYAIAPIARKTVIDDEQVITWNAFEGRTPGRLIFGFLSRVSPDGRSVVSTVNESLYVRNFPDYRLLQVFFPTRGILAYYSRDTGKISALPGADDPDYVQCNGVWTPDGKQLVFARAPARDPYDRERPVATYAGDPNETQIRYDLYRIPFDEGRGGTPEPIVGASNNGMSNSFPKVSPDGKWIVYVQSRNGLLMRPDGKLWIVPVAGGTPRLMRCNTSLMNSWHSFSPNGRWMVFSSKGNRPYTQMFLTHIDEQGNDSPAILLENNTAANRAVNLPEFVNTVYDEFAGISVPAVDHYEHFSRGNQLAREGRISEAIVEFETALEGEWTDWRINDWRIHDSLSKVLLQIGQTERALEHINESLKLNPYNAEMHGNLGYILFEQGQLKRARQHLDMSVRLGPGIASTWYSRGTLRLTVGDNEGAIADYDEAIRLDPEYIEALNGRGIARRTAGDLAGALADFDRGIELGSIDPTTWYFRALIHRELGQPAQAQRDARKASELCTSSSPRCAAIEELRRELGGVR